MKKTLLILGIIALMIPAVSSAENINIQADRQNFDGKTTTFEGNVKVNYVDIEVKSPKVIVKSNNEGKPETATFLDGAHAVKTNGYSQSEVKAKIISLSLLKNRIKAQGNAESSVFENKQPVVHIKAATQEFDINKNIIVATDDVKIDYKDLKTNSRKAKIHVNDNGDLKKVELLGNVRIDQPKSIVNASEVLYNPTTNEMVAYGNADSTITLEDGSLVIIKSEFQQYDNLTKTFITSGHVKIDYKDYIASGPKAVFTPEKNSDKPNKINFIGRSKIVEGERVVEADRIEININPKNFKAEGNVKSRFTQVQSFKEMKKNKS